jgi:S-(hydroxymethyl)glutathione dehydrogenase/alcohol dehydrogenase
MLVCVRAAVFTAPGASLSVQDLRVLPPGPRDVVIRVTASGVCHSDLLAMQGAFPFAPPCVLGHEGTGVVEEVGSAVERLRIGDTVIASAVLACESCFYCMAGEAHLCHEVLAASSRPRAIDLGGGTVSAGWGLGTFAEMMTVDERSVAKVLSELPPEQLALIGCSISTGVGAVLNTARVPAGASVAILGCGGVGLAAVQGARLAGAHPIVGIDLVSAKREQAITFGATEVIDPSAGDVVEQVRALTGGRGVDFAFEVVGHPATITQAFEMTRRGGAAVIIGQAAANATVTFPAQALRSGGRSILGCTFGSVQPRRDYQRFADLAAAGRLDLASMVTRHISLSEVNDAFDALERGEVLRSVIV